MIRRPPRSTLFPYNDALPISTSRTQADALAPARQHAAQTGYRRREARSGITRGRASERSPAAHRSEEHTSELQSRSDLVCRLLLEKKKKTTSDNNQDYSTELN